jgi:hypothetical protein
MSCRCSRKSRTVWPRARRAGGHSPSGTRGWLAALVACLATFWNGRGPLVESRSRHPIRQTPNYFSPQQVIPRPKISPCHFLTRAADGAVDSRLNHIATERRPWIIQNLTPCLQAIGKQPGCEAGISARRPARSLDLQRFDSGRGASGRLPYLHTYQWYASMTLPRTVPLPHE